MAFIVPEIKYIRIVILNCVGKPVLMNSRYYKNVDDMAATGLIGESEKNRLEGVEKKYTVRITDDMVGAINQNSYDDPVYKQFVPHPDELVTEEGEITDPISDQKYSPVKGIVHRYPDRVLLKPVHVCPVYCRFCFRREFVGTGGDALTDRELGAAIDYIADTPDIWEVILSGGDPLMLSPRKLTNITDRLQNIDHVGVVRVHTRLPVVSPQELTDDKITALKIKKATFVVIHVNHVNEMTDAAIDACARLIDSGIPVLSESVLLKGVNDSVNDLEALMRKLVSNRIKPYYLHHPDKARGTRHFRVAIRRGQHIVNDLIRRVSGLCKPYYVLDIPGGHGKVSIEKPYIHHNDHNRWTLEDTKGCRHEYVELNCHESTKPDDKTVHQKTD